MSCGPKKQADWTGAVTALAAILDALTTHPVDSTPVSLLAPLVADIKTLARRATRIDQRVTVRNSGISASVHCALARTAPSGGDLGGP